MMLTLPPDYRPSEAEEFMNPIQTEYFRQKLLRWRAELLREADGTLASLSSQGGIHEADITDRASVGDRSRAGTQDAGSGGVSWWPRSIRLWCGSMAGPMVTARTRLSRSA